MDNYKLCFGYLRNGIFPSELDLIYKKNNKYYYQVRNNEFLVGYQEVILGNYLGVKLQDLVNKDELNFGYAFNRNDVVVGNPKEMIKEFKKQKNLTIYEKALLNYYSDLQEKLDRRTKLVLRKM